MTKTRMTFRPPMPDTSSWNCMPSRLSPTPISRSPSLCCRLSRWRCLLLLYRAQTAALRLKPLVISISDIGRGQVMNYADFSHVPVERVSKYYLARWASFTTDATTPPCSVTSPSR